MDVNSVCVLDSVVVVLVEAPALLVLAGVRGLGPRLPRLSGLGIAFPTGCEGALRFAV